MPSKETLVAVLAVALSASATAFDQHDHDPARHQSPYSSQQPSGIAALSQQELDDLRDGAGMGLARAAELNRYPGPRHVLELASELSLTDAQRARVDEIHAEMLHEAKSVGARILDRERTLDRRFSSRHVEERGLREATRELGELYGELRFVHLAAHLLTAGVLTPEQVAAYDRLRGYERPGAEP